MTDPRDEITKIIEATERAAFKRGWDACRTAFINATAQVKEPSPVPPDGTATMLSDKSPRRTGRPASAAIQVVEDAIAATPGMKGVDVVRAAQSVDCTVKERTVRTCLRRLRIKKVIWKRNGLWYPKHRETLFDDANNNGEAAAPSH